MRQTSVVLLHIPIAGKPKCKLSKRTTQARFFPEDFEIHSPSTAPEITCVMVLRLQPIRGFPLHSGETGTRLTAAIHRRLSHLLFLREGLYTGYSQTSLFPIFLGEGASICTQAKSTLCPRIKPQSLRCEATLVFLIAC